MIDYLFLVTLLNTKIFKKKKILVNKDVEVKKKYLFFLKIFGFLSKIFFFLIVVLVSGLKNVCFFT